MHTRVPKTKTFNGCWTCRRRKVKCPGPRPECSRCAQAGLLCDGFDAKLCWSSSRSGGSCRQRIALPRGVNVLNSYNVKEATRMLNDLEECSRLPNCNASVGPYSVFQVDVTHSPPELPQEGQECGFADYAGELSSSQYGSTFTHIPEGHGHTAASSSFWVDRLLSHYILRLADVLQPINHPQNPFRSIHAQYAMVISTKPLFDTSSRLETSFSSHRVIFHSILSTAAFHLRGLSTARHPEWEFYDHIGRSHRLKALKHMQQAIAEPSLDAETHCARFSAILTLLTSDLVEGSSSEFLTHLQGFHQVRQLYLSKAPGSGLHRSRIRQLDTISFFLTTVAQTTAHHRSEPWHFPTYSGTASLFDTPFTTTDTCLEHTYGITSSIASIIYLINKFWNYANSVTLADESFARELAPALATLARKLNSWTPLSELFASITAHGTATLSLARDLATSFYCSTQIYFHSCFKFNPSQSDQSVFSRLSNRTLLALERAELGKLSVSRAGASICWPAFVAACEAPAELRKRWTKYWHTLLSYRIGSLQAVWDVVQEVWSKADAKAAESSDTQVNAVMPSDSGTYLTSEPVWTDILRESGVTILAI